MDPSDVQVKKVTEVVVVEKEEDSNRMASSDTDSTQWTVGAKKRMPWAGIGALIFVILASLGQMIVLLASNDKPASNWPEYLSPNVCLSILNGVASLAMAFAVVQGIAIAWWRKALLGASIKELHYTWAFSTSITSIFTKFKYFNFIALAALMAKVSIIDGILFQRSIGTYLHISWKDPVTKQLGLMAQTKFPVTGYMGNTNSSEGQMTTEYSNIIINWITTGSGINELDFVYGCEGIACFYGMKGIGFSVDCQDTNVTDHFVTTVANQTGTANKTIFDVDFAFKYPDREKNYSRLEFTSTWPVEELDGQEAVICPTIFTTSKCELRPAIMNYTMLYYNASTIDKSKLKSNKEILDTLKGNSSIGGIGSQLSYSCTNAIQTSLSLYAPTDGSPQDCGKFNVTVKQLQGVQILQPMNIYEPWEASANSSLLGIYNVLRDTFTSEAVLIHSNGSYTVSQTGTMAPIAMLGVPEQRSWCNFSYMDPRDTIVLRLNQLMAQTSVNQMLYTDLEYTDANGNILWAQQPHSQEYFRDIYFTTHTVFMGIALGLTGLVVLCVLPSFWGFWQLGRDVTLGPFEIAYAFQGPAFKSVHGVNGHAEQVVKTVGKTRVQYGEVEDDSGKRLAFKLT